MLAASDVKVTAVDGYEAASAVVAREPVDCVVLDNALAAPPDGFYLQQNGAHFTLLGYEEQSGR